MQEKVLRPLLQRFFTRHETQDGGWQWSRSREQARALVSESNSPYPAVLTPDLYQQKIASGVCVLPQGHIILPQGHIILLTLSDNLLHYKHKME